MGTYRKAFAESPLSIKLTTVCLGLDTSAIPPTSKVNKAQSLMKRISIILANTNLLISRCYALFDVGCRVVLYFDNISRYSLV